MKPEGDVEFCDMDVVVKDPQEVLEEIGLLILEARTPDPSVKGRREGLHCPTTNPKGSSHFCQIEKEECSRAADVKKRMQCAWRNSVPTYIDIYLLPDCVHGQKEAAVVEGTVASMKEKYILLERWYIAVIKKRCEKLEGTVSSSFLIQAVRSYLHFSQLSSWLFMSSGTLSLRIVYRVSAPGEGVFQEFEENPDCHTFPKTTFTDVVLSITVKSLPRQSQIPKLFCSRPVPQDTSKKGRESPKDKPEDTMKDKVIETVYHASNSTTTYQDEFFFQHEYPSKTKKTPKSDFITDYKTCERSEGSISDRTEQYEESNILQKECHTFVSKQSPSHTISSSQCQYQNNVNVDQDKMTTAHWKDISITDNRKSPSRQMFRENLLPLRQEYTSSLQISDDTSKRLHSPKILLATAANTSDSFTKKKRLDLNQTETYIDWEKNYISTKMKPVDVNEYLTNLQNHSFPQSSTSNTCSFSREDLSPRCKFYIGENCDSKTKTSVGVKCSTDEVETPLKRQRERKRSFDEVPRKLFVQSLSSDCCETTPTGRSDQLHNGCDKRNILEMCNDVVTKRYEKDWNSHSVQSSSNSQPIESDMKNGIQDVTDLMDKFSVEDCHKLQVDGNENDEVFCDKDSDGTNCSLYENHSQFASYSNSESPYSKHGHNSPKRAFSVPDYSSDNEVAVTNGFSLCKEEKDSIIKDKTPLHKVLNSPTMEDIMSFQRHLTKSASMMFNQRTGLPSQSSPAPTKRKSGRFDYDSSLTDTKAIKYALSCSKLALTSEGEGDQILEESGKILSTSAPASTNCLLGNFEESVLNGRIEPIGAVDGFTAEIGASGSFCPKHIILPVSAYFFNLSDDNAPSPYLGHINLEGLGKRGYHIPKKGTVQVTLFNPNKTVVKMFVVMYDMSDIPPRSQTFIRQRTLYMPVDRNNDEPSFLRYLIHLRFASTRSCKVYLHTDLRLIFARDKFEFDNKVAQYELRSFTEGPTKPKYSPKR